MSNDFARTRPHRHKEEPAYDFVLSAREEGANIVQEFHDSMTARGGKLYAVISDVCAFANTNGGTLYIGLNDDPHSPILGVTSPEHMIQQLEKEIASRISPPLSCTVDVHETSGKKILRVLVPRGDDPPYAVDDNKIYVRSEAETGLAVRDEIVELVLRQPRSLPQAAEAPVEASRVVQVVEVQEPGPEPASPDAQEYSAPRTGVEVVSVEERNGARYYCMRDLRNGNVVKNVTKSSARRLWHYAITSYAELSADLNQAIIQWAGNLGLVRSQKQGKSIRYDLVQRLPEGYRFYFGVTDEGIHGAWRALVGQEDD
jgi:hypothetical protein